MIDLDKIFSAIDKVTASSERKNIIGIAITGIGATITAIGGTILCTKTQKDTMRIEECDEIDE